MGDNASQWVSDMTMGPVTPDHGGYKCTVTWKVDLDAKDAAIKAKNTNRKKDEPKKRWLW